MPLPLLPVGIGAVTLVVAAFGAAALRERLRQRSAGKKIVIVGPTHSGKTRLHILLTGGSRQLRAKSADEGETFDFKTSRIRMDKVGLDVDAVDTPTSRVGLDEIRAHLECAYLVIFTADAAQMYDDRYRISTEHLATTYRTHANDARWMLALTHRDHLVLPSSPDSRVGKDWPFDKLAKLLDDPEAVAYNLLDELDANEAVQRVLVNLVHE